MSTVADADSFSDIRTSVLRSPTPIEDPLYGNLSGLWRQTHWARWGIQPHGPSNYPSLSLSGVIEGSIPLGKADENRPQSHRKVTFVTFSLWWDYTTFSNKAAASKLGNQCQWEDGGQPALEALTYCGDRRSSKSLLQEREALASHAPMTLPSHQSLEQLLLNFGPEGWGSTVHQRSIWPMLEGSRLAKEGSLQHRLVLTSLAQQRWQHCSPLNPWCLCSDMKDMNQKQLLIVILERGGINSCQLKVLIRFINSRMQSKLWWILIIMACILNIINSWST